MRYQSSGLTVALSAKGLWQRALFAALAALSLLLIYAERKEKGWAETLRVSLLSVTAPVAEAVASPARALEDIAAGWHDVWNVHSENRQLHFDNAQLMQWREAALRLEAENAALRALMQYQPEQANHFITAKTVGAAAGGLSHRLQINAGLEDGVTKQLPVVGGQGMVGRVLNVGPSQAEVLLLTDIRSRVPVRLYPSGERAILMGDHHRLPFLKLANPKARPPLGETVLTSDDGGLLPAGLRVGTLFAARDGRLEVRPAFHEQRMEYVRVLARQTR